MEVKSLWIFIFMVFYYIYFKPLNPNPDSKWRAYFKDNEMLLQIDKDCR